jgi:FSR family fosmidomycin resistance protein-like MFS transporter
MNLTRKLIGISLPDVTLQSSGLVILFALVHTVSDAVTNMLSALLPTIQSRFELSETVLALLVATLSFSALVTQPLFGALADRLGNRRIAALGVMFNAILFSLIGIIPNIHLLFGLILIGGLASAALHPAMASMARQAGGKKPEVAVGLFSAGGTLGIAVGPIIIMVLLANLGLSFTPWLMIPGILFGVMMFMLPSEETQSIARDTNRLFDFGLLARPVGLLALTGILSNVAFVTFMSGMPLWLVREHHLASNSTLIGWTLSAFSLAAAFGGIVGGLVSKKLGARRLIVGSLLLALVPLYSIFFLAPGSPAYFAMVLLAGALVNAGMPMLIVSAQDHAPKAAATAAGMLMGFSAGVAGLVYVGIGRLQESLGLTPAIMVAYLALAVGAVFALIAIKPNKANDQPPVDATSCFCSPCIDQNIAAYPKRIIES